MEKALYYRNSQDGIVQCELCPRECMLTPDQVGVCRTRVNLDGVLHTRNFGQCSSMGMDPIEKKPLYHYFPGSDILSVGTVGCNFRCQFCQNWQIAQSEPQTTALSSNQIVDYVLREQKENPNCIGIAYTYSEPLVWYEYVLATAKLAKEKGLKNVLVTNGYIKEKPLAELLPFIDAMNIDVKGFTSDFYRRYCGGELEPVLITAETAQKSCHVEITTLVIPGLNDSEDELNNLVSWVDEYLGSATPLHFSRYFPNYKLHIEPTPISTLHRARELSESKLYYVYLGNIGGENTNTYCPGCKELLIKRSGYRIELVGLNNRICTNCGREIEVVM